MQAWLLALSSVSQAALRKPPAIQHAFDLFLIQRLFLSISWPSVPSSLSRCSPRLLLSKYLLCAKDWTLLLGSGECCLKHKRLSREQLYWLNIHFLPFCFCKSPWCCLWLTAPPAHLWPWIPLGNVTELQNSTSTQHKPHILHVHFQRGKREEM